MVKVRGINHITLAVRDLERAVDFYTRGLGLDLRKRWDSGAYLEAGDLWLCLSVDERTRTTPHPDYTHFAFDVAATDFDALVRQLQGCGAIEWKQNKSEGPSFYFLDPDGHKLEIHVGTLESRLAAMKSAGK